MQHASLLALLAVPLLHASAWADPAYNLHLSATPTAASVTAATELEDYLQRITGRQVVTFREGSGEPPAGRTVYVGDSEALRRVTGLSAEGLDPEQIVVRSTAEWAAVMGCDVGPTGFTLNGTLWAAYEFLERLGVRWLWPGELGEVVPSIPDLQFPDLDIRYTPPIIQRNIRNIQYNERVQSGLDKLGFTREQYDAIHKDGGAWFRRQRIGTQGKFSYGHAYGHWWDSYHEAHPDWFALQPDGTRNQPNIGSRSRLCVSNPEVIAKAAEEAIARLEADPALYCASISPNDGGRATFCLCDACQALDPPGQMVKVWHPTDPEFTVHSLTDRYVHFYSEVAKIVAARFPDRYLGAYAYSAYSLPPLQEKLHPNVFIGFVGLTYTNEAERKEDLAAWDAWTKAAARFFLRPNLLIVGMGYPTVFPHRMAEDLKHCFDTGMRVTDFDCCYQDWAHKGLNYYILARILWDPGLDVDAAIDDYCKAGWGPAAGAVRRYFDRLEAITYQVAVEGKDPGHKADPRIMASCYPDEVMAELQGLLDEARALAGGDATVLARVGFLQQGLDYSRLSRDRRMAYGNLRAEEGDRETLDRAQRALDDFCRELGIAWSVNTPYLKFYGF